MAELGRVGSAKTVNSKATAMSERGGEGASDLPQSGGTGSRDYDKCLID